MKKFTLSILAITCAGFSFSQSTKPLKAPDKSFMFDAPYQAKSIIAAQPALPQMSYQTGAKSTNSISFVPLGSAGNILTVLQGACNVVAASDARNLVIFIHRNDPSIFGETIAQYRYDISRDEGASFLNNVGTLNPAADNQVGGINSRYPMVAIYNPPGKTAVDSVWGVYFGTWHNGASTANTWDGSATGVFQLWDTAGTTWTETNVVQNNLNIGITSSLCNGKPGEFWGVDFDDLGDADSIIIAYKGVWNNVTRDVDWIIAHYLNLPLTLDAGTTTHNIQPTIAFDPSGMNGWIATSADVIPNTNQIYEPIFLRTTDGGATWSAPMHLDLTQFPDVMATMNPGGSGVPTTAFDGDLVVDMNGNPHYGIVIGSGTGWSIESGLNLRLFDFSYNGTSWSATIVDTIQTFRGDVAIGAAGTYSTDNRPQLSISPTGDKVFFMWSDSDPLLTGGTNALPELFGKGLSVTNGIWSPTINFTQNDLVWDPHLSGFPNFYPSVAPTSLRNSGQNATLVPVVVMRVNGSGNADDPATFYYFNNIQFDDALFVGMNETPAVENTIAVFPSPASDQITVYFNGLENANASVAITDVLGKTVKHLGNSFSGFERYNISGLEAGIYLLNIKTKSGIVTQRFQITK